MSTSGHFITLIGVVFFFFMFLDSHIERKLAIPSSLSIPRFNKRISYYIFKINYLSLITKKNKRIPNFNIQKIINKKYFNEYEQF